MNQYISNIKRNKNKRIWQTNKFKLKDIYNSYRIKLIRKYFKYRN